MVTAVKNFTFVTMPQYLVVQVSRYDVGSGGGVVWNCRYYVDPSWQLAKLNCSVPMPMELSMERYHNKSPGMQPGEKPMPDSNPGPTATTTNTVVEADEEIVVMLMSMGFDMDQSKRACLKVGNR